jgi:iron complex outermembrane recepter protein
MKRHDVVLCCACSIVAIVSAGAARAQAEGAAPSSSASAAAMPAPEPSAAGATHGVQEIVVTAQKRAQSLTDVPMSITAATGDKLAEQGVKSTADLSRIVPGFNYTESAYSTPVYTLRGVGFYDTSLGAKSTVAVYTDEVPIPFAIETQGATLDLQRVEVLKGPQGTLFGQNSTGGAINYIAAKPTQTFHAGGEIGYQQYGQFDANGYVTGGLTNTLTARLAVMTQQGGDWQKSYTRDDKLGGKNFTTGRLLVDFKPTDRLRFELNLNGFINKSDGQAAQYIAFTPLNQNPAHYGVLPTYPLAPHNDRAADWSPDNRPKHNDRYYAASFRGDYDLGDHLTLTSITAYSHYKPDYKIDTDGGSFNAYFYTVTGKIDAISQELRLTGKLGSHLQYIIGGNYSHEHVLENNEEGPSPDETAAYQLTDVVGTPPFFHYRQFSNQKFENKAVFANVDYDIGKFTIHGGVRYTDAKIRYSGSTCDIDGGLAAGIGTLLNAIRGQAGLPADISIPQGGCVTIYDDPTQSNFLTPGIVSSSLHQHNVSWRGGVDYKVNPRTMFYVSVSKGYKSGSYPLLSASGASQLRPVTQESVLAYEAGLKATLLDHTLQVSAAGFYYDYNNKQLKGRIVGNPDIFGPLETLVNIPKSSIKGGEMQFDIAPAKGLNFTIASTYIDSKIKRNFTNYTQYGDVVDFGGESFPFTPKIQVMVDGQYEFPVSNDFDAFFGSSVTYQSKTNSALGDIALLKIDDYALVDARFGFATADKKYRLTFFGRNLANKYYWTNATRIIDTTVRLAGRPRTFGATLSARY